MRPSPSTDSSSTEGTSQPLNQTPRKRTKEDQRRTSLQLVSDPFSRPVPSTGNEAVPQPELGPSIVENLSQRKLVQWTVAYLVAAFGLLQLTDVLIEIWIWPLTLQKGVSLVLGMGLFPAIVIAWFHGEKGRQDVCALEVAILGTLIACAGIAVWYLSGALVA